MLAALEQASGDAEEAARLGRECARYAAWLRR